MKLQWQRLVIVGIFFCTPAPTWQSSNDPLLDARLKTARAAIGNDATLRELKSLILQGTARHIEVATGVWLDPNPLEVRILLPNRYVRIETDRFAVRREGVSGDALGHDWKPVNPNVQLSTEANPDQIKSERALFARLLLGMLADCRAILPLEVRPGISPPGTETIAFIGPDGFAAALDLDPTSHIPAGLRFEADVRFPQPMTSAQAGKRTTFMPPPSERAEVTLTFEDRRVVDGLRLPYRIRRSARGVTFEDVRLDTIRVNAPLRPGDFM